MSNTNKIVNNIPDDWKFLKNKYIFEKRKEKVNENYRNFQLLSLTTKGVRKKDIETTGGKLPESFNTYQRVYKKDLILCLFDLDVSAVFSGLSNFDGMITSAYDVFKVKKGFNEEFFKYLFDLYKYDRYYIQYSKSLRKTINTENFLSIATLVPPFQTQQKIANLLAKMISRIDKIIEETNTSIEELKRYKQSLITEVVKKGLDKNVEMKDSGIKIIGDIKKSYKIIPLKYIGSFQNGISKPSDYFGEGDPFISYGDVYNNRALPKNVTGLAKSSKQDQIQYSVEEGDIFFTRTSETLEEIAFSSICFKTIPKAVFSGFVIRFRPYKLENINLMFLSYYLESEYIRHYFAREMNIVTRASLSQSLLGSLPIIQPSIEEQQEIVDYIHPKIKNIDSLIRDKNEIIKEYESYKKSLIYEYVTGKKEVGEEVE